MGANWNVIGESQFGWEREALEFIRERFPDHEPWRAWSNLEFIAEDGSVNEVDLLVFSPQGFFLIEIKSDPGILRGDTSTWVWESNGRRRTVDNPLYAANLKAKKLRSLLNRQKVARKKGSVPFIEELVFCSAPDLRCELEGAARTRVCLRDREAEGDRPARPGILAAIGRRHCPGLSESPKGVHDRPTARLVSQALEQAGIRPFHRDRKVSDYDLVEVIGSGPGYQDWKAAHATFDKTYRRVRIYLVRTEANEEDRRIIQRAAEREFHLLERLDHPGILKAHTPTESTRGPAIIYEYDPNAVRLDHYLVERNDKLSIDLRLHLLHQIADAVRFAHEHKVIHRALSPQSILVTDPDSDRPRIKIFNWQAGFREGGSSSTGQTAFTITVHADRIVDDTSRVYMAPEALSDPDLAGEHLDVFSLGAIAYHLLSGQPPATNSLELNQKLLEHKGLSISSVLNGAGQSLESLIRLSTHPDVSVRVDSVVDFLERLDDVEDELTAPSHEVVEDPAQAKAGDLLPENYEVVRHLGQGGCSTALLVKRDDEHYVLKVATNPEHNARVRDEAAVLQKLRHAHVVEFCRSYTLGDHEGFLMRPVFAEKDKLRIETLGQRLRKEGRLHLDLLQRFGEDLLNVVMFLEEQGIPHRDIKPDNIAVGAVGRGSRLHVVLFDFSLARTPMDNIRAGTPGYLDPLLPLRKPPRWDLHAERYAAAMTLHELATGTLPQWGDGKTDPVHVSDEIAIEPELFDPSLREELTEFFKRAFRRNPAERFDNAEQMLRAWRGCFEGIEEPGPVVDDEGREALAERLDAATLDTSIHELGLGTRACNALDRANVLNVDDLLSFPLRKLQRLRGVGNKTRREILEAVRILHKRLDGQVRPVAKSTAAGPGTIVEDEAVPVETMGIDLLVQRITRPGSRANENTRRTLRALLGLLPEVDEPWPSQSEVAAVVEVTRARVQQLVGKFQERWCDDPSLTRLRSDIAEMLEGAGGVMSAEELAQALLAARGSAHDEPDRTRYAMAVARAAVEAERSLEQPRFFFRRSDGRTLITVDPDRAEYALRLGREADKLAGEDPLVAPARVVERLQGVKPPRGDIELPEARLVRLAAAASRGACVSSRQELYPRAMEAARALKLSQGALVGVPQLSVEDVRTRVRSRYPEAAPLPDRPALDALLRETGLGLRWEPSARDGKGAYVNPVATSLTYPTSTGPLTRYPTAPGDGGLSPEIADARLFDERLERAAREGAFLVLLVSPKQYEQARDELARRFPVEVVDFEGLFIETLRRTAEKARVNWDLVVQTDATRGGRDWDRLLMLVRRAVPEIEARLLESKRTVLLVFPELIGRYDQMEMLERLRDQVGRRDGLPGLWVLLAGSTDAEMEGKVVPILSPGQKIRIPERWIRNEHRAALGLKGVNT